MAQCGMSRRDYLKVLGRMGLLTAAAGLGLAGPFRWFESASPALALAGEDSGKLLRSAPLARFWISTAQNTPDCTLCHEAGEIANRTAKHSQIFIKCQLCAQGCVIPEGGRGKCQTRQNVKGELRTLVYGRPIAMHVDPIEKKPFFHFLPGSQAFSLATSGCPLSCQFCQNWEISQAKPEDYSVKFHSAQDITTLANRRKAPVIAFTYNEPTVFAEYLIDIASHAKTRGLRSVLVSCGFMQAEPLAEMLDLLDAIKIDLKGFSQDFYQNVCQAELKPVLRSIAQIARSHVHLEIVNLVVPTLNDSDRMMADLVDWIAGELGPDVPVHFTRFHPDYKLLNLPPTPMDTLEKIYNLARKKGLHYPYVGNVPGHPGNHTYCPHCGRIIIKRNGFFVLETHLDSGTCAFCQTPIAGVWI